MSVAFDAVGPSSGGMAYGGVTSFSWTHTPVGTPTAVAIGSSGLSGLTETFSYGGTAVPQAGNAGDSFSGFAILCGLANPPAGAQTVAIGSVTPTDSGGAGSITVTGSDLSTCFSNVSAGATGISGTTAVDAACTSAVGELVVDILCLTSHSDTMTPGGGQTLRWNGASTFGGQSTAPGASPFVTMQELFTNSQKWKIISASFKAAAAPAVTGWGPLFGGQRNRIVAGCNA